MLRDATVHDSANICEIYNHYILSTVVTFEEKAVTPSEMSARINKIRERFPWIVFEHENEILGYAYATEWKSRAAYKHTAETTVYLDSAATRQGIGSRLYQSLLERLELLGFHVAIAGIALPNEASVGLHERFGFTKVAQFGQVGRKFDRWIDVGYWELRLPRPAKLKEH